MQLGVEDKTTASLVDMLPNHHTIAAAMLCASFEHKAMVLAIDRGYARRVGDASLCRRKRGQIQFEHQSRQLYMLWGSHLSDTLVVNV